MLTTLKRINTKPSRFYKTNPFETVEIIGGFLLLNCWREIGAELAKKYVTLYVTEHSGNGRNTGETGGNSSLIKT